MSVLQEMMKVVCGILSVLGLYWAWTAFAIYFLLAIVIFEGRDREFSEIAYVVVGSLLATVGYWIWTGWIFCCTSTHRRVSGFWWIRWRSCRP